MSKNNQLLKSFTEYCDIYPDLRFWQALLSWSKLPYICWTSKPPEGSKFTKDTIGGDTFYWNDKNN